MHISTISVGIIYAWGLCRILYKKYSLLILAYPPKSASHFKDV